MKTLIMAISMVMACISTAFPQPRPCSVTNTVMYNSIPNPVPYGGGQYSISFDVVCVWSPGGCWCGPVAFEIESPPWIQCTPPGWGGYGIHTIDVTIFPNASGRERSGTIHLSYAHGISVDQSAGFPTPDLVSPANEALITADTAAFVWRSPGFGADYYTFQLAFDPFFTSYVVNDSTLRDTTAHVRQLQHNQTYWWRVRAYFRRGWGQFGEERSILVYLEIPDPPLLVSPANGDTNVSVNPALDWDASAGSGSYTMQLSDTMDFSRLLLDEDSITTTSLDASGLSIHTTYYWRVRATNDFGISDWSEVWSFTTAMPPNQVMLASPENGAIIPDVSAICRWMPSVPQADRYWFEWASDSLFMDARIDSSGTDTISVASPLQINQTYYWKVRAQNGAGWGPFSDVWSFSVLITDVEPGGQIPTMHTLSQNYPNPFNPSTVIGYGLPEKAGVKLEVFNVLGQTVALLVDTEQEAGYHEVRFDATNLAGGLYLYRLQAGYFVQSRKLLLVR